MGKIIIAIDGYSSCGKSTLARAMAENLNYLYIDSGAMYRAVTLHFLRNNIAVDDSDEVASALQQLRIEFREGQGKMNTILNGENVEEAIRQMSVSNYVSQVAAVPEVRRAMVAQQRSLGKNRGIVMDGRDIGTVVFPDAELKIFLTADREERVRRRYEELRRKGVHVDREAVKENLAHRDHLDSTRSDSPLEKAKDAVVIDNSNLTEEEQLAMSLALASERMRQRTA